MKKTKIYDAAARLLLVLLSLMMLAVGVRYAARKIVVEHMRLQGRTVSRIFFDVPELVELPELPAAAPDAVPDATPAEPVRDSEGIVWSTQIDWAALYPPRETAEAEAHTGLAWRFADAVDRLTERFAPFNEAVAEFEEEIDLFTGDYAVGYGKMVEAANAYDALLGWEIVNANDYNPVIELEDNYFVSLIPRRDFSEWARQTVQFDRFLQRQGMEHLFVCTTNKVCREDDASGVIDFYNQNADSLLGKLRAGGVPTMDLRENLHAAGMEHHESYFQTDHHWKCETGLWAAGELAKKLNADCGFDIDLSLLDAENFDAQVYEDWFLGSQGKKVTLSRAQPEDISIIYPRYPVDLSLEIPSLDLSKRGGFDIIYRKYQIEEKDYYNRNPYGAYLYGDHALCRLENHALSDGKRVLVLGQSYDNSVVPFLALGVQYVDVIDLREFTGDLEAYLLENPYDAVVELYTANLPAGEEVPGG